MGGKAKASLKSDVCKSLENGKSQPCDHLIGKQPRLRRFKSKGPKVETMEGAGGTESIIAEGQ